MPRKINPFWEGYITAFSDAKFNYSAIIEACKKRGSTISKNGIYSVKNKKRKTKMGLVPEGKKQAHAQPATSGTTEVVRKVKALVSRKNPGTQSAIVMKLSISLKSVNTIINKDLNLENVIRAMFISSYLDTLKNDALIAESSMSAI